MICELCGREVTVLTTHHLVPRSRRGSGKDVVGLCKACHGMIHRLFTNKELAENFHDLDRLKSHPYILRFVSWVRKQDPARRVKIR
jgi:hypothetical protein